MPRWETRNRYQDKRLTRASLLDALREPGDALVDIGDLGETKGEADERAAGAVDVKARPLSEAHLALGRDGL